jgi:hypothetical protein
MYSVTDVPTLPGTGFPIQKSPDQSLFSSSPKLIAACHVFHRLLTPRHPPFALNSLATKQLTQSYQTFSCTYKQIVKEQCDDNLYKKNNCLLLKKSSQVLLLTLVEVNGFEPMTSCVQGRRSPS